MAAVMAASDLANVRAAIKHLVKDLRDSNPSVAAAAAESIFDLGVKGGYASAVATNNRKEIGLTEGVFEGFSHLVSYGTDEGQGWACAALAQIAFDNASNCISIVRTPGMLSGLRKVMEHSSKDSKAAAALAVNNISAFSEQASAIIVQADVLNINSASASSLEHLLPFLTPSQCRTIEEGRTRNGAYKSLEDIQRVDHTIDKCTLMQLRTCRRPNLVLTEEPGLLDALKQLCRAEHTDARTDAVGAVNHISRSDQARPILIAHNIVHDALAPALLARYDGEEELDAIVARATMAMANIMAHTYHPQSRTSSYYQHGQGAGSSQTQREAGAAPDVAAETAAVRGVEDSGLAVAGSGGAGLAGDGGRLEASRASDAGGALRRPIEEYIAICRLDGEGYMEVREAALGILVRCLQYAIEGKKWVGITWGIFSVVHALRNLSENAANKRVLTSNGLVQLLGGLLDTWIALHVPPHARTSTSEDKCSDWMEIEGGTQRTLARTRHLVASDAAAAPPHTHPHTHPAASRGMSRSEGGGGGGGAVVSHHPSSIAGAAATGAGVALVAVRVAVAAVPAAVSSPLVSPPFFWFASLSILHMSVHI